MLLAFTQEYFFAYNIDFEEFGKFSLFNKNIQIAKALLTLALLFA